MPAILLLATIAMITPVVAYVITPELGPPTLNAEQHPAVAEAPT